MSSYNDRFTGSVINPSTVSYEALTLNQPITALSWPIVYQENPLIVSSYISVTSLNASYVMQMPDATQTSVGQATIVANVGSNNFGITDSTGAVIQANIQPTQIYFLILTDNSTPAGIWQTLLFGATTATANAAGLAGFGLTALLNGKLNTYTPVTSISAPYTVTLNDRAKLFVWTGGTDNVTLPNAATALNGFCVSFNNASTIGGLLNITSAGGTIDGETFFTVSRQESSMFISDGTNWYSLGFGNSALFAVTVLELGVTPGGTFTLTPEEAQREIHTVSGVLSQNAIVQVPATPNYYMVRNITTGAFTLTYKLIGGATNNIIPQGQQLIVYSDGLDLRIIPSVAPGTISFNSGTSSNPSVTFIDDTSTGLFLNSVGNLGISAAGSLCSNVSAAGLQVIDGTLALPSLACITDGTLGFFKSAASTLTMAASGAAIYSAAPTGISLAVIPGTPSYNFIGNLTSGIGFTPGTPSLDFYLNGTIGASLLASGVNIPFNTGYNIGSINIMSLMEVYAS